MTIEQRSRVQVLGLDDLGPYAEILAGPNLPLADHVVIQE
jgi:hypothetical protein